MLCNHVQCRSVHIVFNRDLCEFYRRFNRYTVRHSNVRWRRRVFTDFAWRKFGDVFSAIWKLRNQPLVFIGTVWIWPLYTHSDSSGMSPV